MRAHQFLTEYTVLSRSKLMGPGKEKENRVGKFVELIQSGHQFNSQVGPLTIDPSNIPAIQQFFTPGATTPRLALKTSKGDIMLGQVYYDDTAWRGAKSRGTSDITVKPSQIWQAGKLEKNVDLTSDLAIDMGAFPATELGQRILSNTVLDSQGQVGQIVKAMAKQIMDGQVPTIPENLSKQEIGAIQNDAFEYLGILAIIYGVAEFPELDAFYKHLGAKLNDFILFFPGSTSSPLADSFALQNKQTGNKIFLSSKGGKTGSPSSINELQIPEYLTQSNDDTISFIQMLQESPKMFQPFKAANWIHENYPGALGGLEKFLPFDDAFFNYIGNTWKNQKNGVPSNVEQMPREYQPLFQFIQDQDTAGKWDHPLFYYVRYITKTFVHTAIKNKRALPDFSERMIEIFGWNFVVVKTKPQRNTFVTMCQWPAKVGGSVTFEHKDPAHKWTSAMTWILN